MVFGDSYLCKNYVFTRNSLEKPAFPGAVDLRARNSSKLPKNDSQGVVFAIIFLPRGTTLLLRTLVRILLHIAQSKPPQNCQESHCCMISLQHSTREGAHGEHVSREKGEEGRNPTLSLGRILWAKLWPVAKNQAGSLVM